VSVNENVMHTNAAAARIVEPADRAILWSRAGPAVAGRGQADGTPYLSAGLPVLVRGRPVNDSGILAGALLLLEPQVTTRPDQAWPA
jgi:hypothetical protein